VNNCWTVVGNSGKPVTLETSGIMKFVKWVFRNLKPAKPRSRELAKIWNLEPAKLRSRELAKIWNLESAKLRSRELAKIWSLEPAKLGSREPVKIWSLKPAKLLRSRTCEDVRGHEIGSLRNSGIRWTPRFGSHGIWKFPEWGDSRTSKKPSQRRCLKKSGFGVWTSGKLVNVWDVKDIHVCVHIGNIPWIRGYFWNVKVPSSPYKRGRKGTCKRIRNFWGLRSF
jgi:hypothetical protein